MSYIKRKIYSLWASSNNFHLMLIISRILPVLQSRTDLENSNNASVLINPLMSQRDLFLPINNSKEFNSNIGAKFNFSHILLFC